MEEEGLTTLEGKLSTLNIKEETYKEDSENDKVVELKAKFTSLLQKAKAESKNGDIEGALHLYKKAYRIHKSDKLAKRIERLEAILDNSDSDSSSQNEGSTDCGDGFLLSDHIYNKLYPYQKEGVHWFWKLYQENKGGILGDDMGLGKTIQVISFLSGMFEQGHIKTALIVMPVSLLANWLKEFEKWAPDIRVRDFHGSNQKQRSDNLTRIQSRNGVCLTTYGLANTCHSQFSQDRYGREFLWDYIILDEGHKIKNTANKTTQAIRCIPATNHFILTGTPIQNNLREMWALFDFVCEGQLLGTSRSFKQEYENPIVRARERDATAYEKRIGQEMSTHLRELIAPHFLRRTKAILENKQESSNDNVDGEVLPKETEVDGTQENDQSKSTKQAKLTRKNDLIIWLYLSETQLQIYKDFLALDRVKQILMTTRSPLAELNVLKKVCDHPRLLSTMACQQLGLNEETDEDCDEKYQWCAPPVDQLVQESGKMVFLVQLLQQLQKEGHRTLIFSQSRKMLDIIQKVLKDKRIKMIRIDGTITSVAERESRINIFQNDPSFSVFLLTTQVGGVGLTLTAANRVVIFDPSWNPATDAQAVDRAYRIGQKSTVVVYRLITCGSLEEKIYRKQVFKQAITKQTTGSSNNPMRYFTRHDLRDLFVLDDPRSSKTQLQLNKMHSSNRVSDDKLDEHLVFLHSTDIFGISDHDLLFTKEAVASQEELIAASEMGDVINAKVRRAADIMKAESSQAVRGGSWSFNNTSSATKKKTSQTKIHDHIEVFKPAREDSKRFMPKHVKPSLDSDVVDLTVLDNKMDDIKLDEQFSAFTIKDDEPQQNDPSKVNQIILDDTNENISQQLSTSSNNILRNHNSSVATTNTFQEATLDSSRQNESKNSNSSDVVSLDDSCEDESSEKSGNISRNDEDYVETGKDILEKTEDNSSGVFSSSTDDIGGDFEIVRAKGIKKSRHAVISDESDEDESEGEEGNNRENGIMMEKRTSFYGTEENKTTEILVKQNEISSFPLTKSTIVNREITNTVGEITKVEDNRIDDENNVEKNRVEDNPSEDGKNVEDNTSKDEKTGAMNRSREFDSNESGLGNNEENLESDDERSDNVEGSVMVRDSLGEGKDNRELGKQNESDDEGSSQISENTIEDSEGEENSEYGKMEDSEGEMRESEDEGVNSEEENVGDFEDINDRDIRDNKHEMEDSSGSEGEDKVSEGGDDSEENIRNVDESSDGDGEKESEDALDSEENVREIENSSDNEGDGKKPEDALDSEGNVREIENGSDNEGDSKESEDSEDNVREIENSSDNEGDSKKPEDALDSEGNVREIENGSDNEDDSEESGDALDSEGNVMEIENGSDNEGDSKESEDSEDNVREIENGSDNEGDSKKSEDVVDSEDNIRESTDEVDGSEDESSENDEEGDDNEDDSGNMECNEGDSSQNDESSTVRSSSSEENVTTKISPKRRPISSDEGSEEENKENIRGNCRKKTEQASESKKVMSFRCPRGKHVSDVVNIRRCPCVMTSEEQEAYKMHVITARRYEKSKQIQNAYLHFTKAFQLCDSDEKLHYRINKVYSTLKSKE